MRKFFGFSVEAPWPENLPEGRILPIESRHLTVAFLGERDFSEEVLKPPFMLSPAGVIRDILFLRNVVAYAPVFFNDDLKQFQVDLHQFLGLEEGKWLPHITISRTVDHENEWREQFSPFPFYLKEFCLFQTEASLTYAKVQSFPLVPPFEEIPHVADIAFRVRGRDVQELYLHAALALSFRAESLAKWDWGQEARPKTLHEVVSALNHWIYRLDIEEGSPLKAVSHAGLIESKPGYLEWEMIVDV